MRTARLSRYAWVFVFAALAMSTSSRADVRLVGNTFVHAWTINPYPDGTPAPKYETRFCDDRTLVWSDVTDMSNVKSGIEEYELTEISPGVLQVTWKESPDTTDHGVVWTLNFGTYGIYGVVAAVLSRPAPQYNTVSPTTQFSSRHP